MTLLLAAAWVSSAVGCDPAEPLVPLDRAAFPTGLALAGDRLLVISSNFDLAFEDGALLSADLETVRGQLGAGSDAVVEGPAAYTAAALIPPFGDKPVLTSLAERVYIPTRGNNRVVALDIAADGSLSCGAPAPGSETDAEADTRAPRCGESPFALQLAAADPFDILITDEVREDGALVRVGGLVTFLSSSEVFFFADDRRLAAAEQLRITGSSSLSELVSGVRSAVLRPAVAGSDPVVIAAVDVNNAAGSIGAGLVLFAPVIGGGLIAYFDVTLVTGALFTRDIVLVPGQDGDNDALVVVLRGPDGLARFEIDERGALPSLRLTGVSSTCRGPTGLEYVRLAAPGALAGAVDRVLLTCQDGDTVEAIDPLTLRTTDSVPFFGRGPYDVVVNTAVTPPEAFVSFFLDDSIGVLQFEEVDGLPRLVPRGRIGEPEPRPEDGRE